MQTQERISCSFCGTPPVATNSSGQRVCSRHSDAEDTGSKRKRDDSQDTHDDFAVPFLVKKKKTKTKGPKMPLRECMICMSNFRVAGVTCGAKKHHSCKACTRMYIEKTLGERGAVYFERIPCLDRDCWSNIAPNDARSVLTKKSVAKMEKREWDIVYNIVGEVDPSSQKLMNDKTKLCPSCKVPIEKHAGCDHLRCLNCNHDFWWTCGGIGGTCTNYPFHSEGCSAGYASAPTVNG